MLKQKYSEQSDIIIGKYSVDINSRSINNIKESLKLTQREVQIILFLKQSKSPQSVENLQKEVWGHKSGHSLFQLHQFGVDKNDRIINSTSPEPILTVSNSEIKYFQKEITLVNLIDETNLQLIINKIQTD